MQVVGDGMAQSQIYATDIILCFVVYLVIVVEATSWIRSCLQTSTTNTQCHGLGNCSSAGHIDCVIILVDLGSFMSPFKWGDAQNVRVARYATRIQIASVTPTRKLGPKTE